MMTVTFLGIAVPVLAVLASGVALGVSWQRRREARTGMLWLLDHHGRPIPIRLHGTDPREARIDVEPLAAGDTIGVGLRFDDGRVVRHHFGRSLSVARRDRLSIPLPRAFLPHDRAA